MNNDYTMPRSDSSLEEFISRKIWIIVASLVFLAGLTASGVLYFYSSTFDGEPTTNHEMWGQFGDFVAGTLNPIFSFFTLLALLVTIILQSFELRQARGEASRTADAMAQQVDETIRATNTRAFLDAAALLQKEELREARAHVFDLHRSNKSVTAWNTQDRKYAEQVCHNYDLIGMMVEYEMVKQYPLIRAWKTSIQKSWEATSELVHKRREKEKDDKFWQHFEMLYDRVEKLDNKQS